METFLTFGKEYSFVFGAASGSLAAYLLGLLISHWRREKRWLGYSTTSRNVVQAGPTKLTLYYDGNEIKRLDSHTVVFRNTGNRPLKALPVTIECTNGGTVLERELSVPDGAKFETTSDQNSIFVNIDLLNPGETFSVGFSVADAASPGGIKVVARAEFLKLRNIGVQVDTAELLDELMRGMPFGRLIAIMVRAL